MHFFAEEPFTSEGVLALWKASERFGEELAEQKEASSLSQGPTSECYVCVCVCVCVFVYVWV